MQIIRLYLLISIFFYLFSFFLFIYFKLLECIFLFIYILISIFSIFWKVLRLGSHRNTYPVPPAGVEVDEEELATCCLGGDVGVSFICGYDDTLLLSVASIIL